MHTEPREHPGIYGIGTIDFFLLSFRCELKELKVKEPLSVELVEGIWIFDCQFTQPCGKLSWHNVQTCHYGTCKYHHKYEPCMNFHFQFRIFWFYIRSCSTLFHTNAHTYTQTGCSTSTVMNQQKKQWRGKKFPHTHTMALLVSSVKKKHTHSTVVNLVENLCRVIFVSSNKRRWTAKYGTGLLIVAQPAAPVVWQSGWSVSERKGGGFGKKCCIRHKHSENLFCFRALHDTTGTIWENHPVEQVRADVLQRGGTLK